MSVISTYMMANVHGVGGRTVIGGWGMHDGSSPLADESGGGHTATVTGSPTYGSTALIPSGGASILWSGTGQYAQVAHFAGVGPDVNDFWFWMAFKTTLNGSAVPFSYFDWADAAANGFGMIWDGTNFTMKVAGMTDVVSASHGTTAWRDGNAHTLSGDYDRDGNAQLYRGIATSGSAVSIAAASGVKVGNGTGSGQTAPLDIASRHGSGNSDLPWSGNFQDFWYGTGLLGGTARADLDSIFATGSLPSTDLPPGANRPRTNLQAVHQSNIW